MKLNWKLRGLILALTVIVVDQLSKWWIVVQTFGDKNTDFFSWLLQTGPQLRYSEKPVTSFLNLVMVWNPGVSFGMLQQLGDYAVHGLTAFALLVCGGFLIWLWREPKSVRSISIGLIVGGALGNVWDRFRFQAVADFIDVHVGVHHWPAFNVADSAICVGVALLLIENLFFTRSA